MEVVSLLPFSYEQSFTLSQRKNKEAFATKNIFYSFSIVDLGARYCDFTILNKIIPVRSRTSIMMMVTDVTNCFVSSENKKILKKSNLSGAVSPSLVILPQWRIGLTFSA